MNRRPGDRPFKNSNPPSLPGATLVSKTGSGHSPQGRGPGDRSANPVKAKILAKGGPKGITPWQPHPSSKTSTQRQQNRDDVEPRAQFSQTLCDSHGLLTSPPRTPETGPPDSTGVKTINASDKGRQPDVINLTRGEVSLDVNLRKWGSQKGHRGGDRRDPCDKSSGLAKSQNLKTFFDQSAKTSQLRLPGPSNLPNTKPFVIDARGLTHPLAKGVTRTQGRERRLTLR